MTVYPLMLRLILVLRKSFAKKRLVCFVQILCETVFKLVSALAIMVMNVEIQVLLFHI